MSEKSLTAESMHLISAVVSNLDQCFVLIATISESASHQKCKQYEMFKLACYIYHSVTLLVSL